MDQPTTLTLEDQMKARFTELPEVVQRAITSSEVEKHLQTLAENQKLHLDQWQTLENEVILTLLGIQKVADLEKNIQAKVHVTADDARILSESITKVVFEPIRSELERSLGHPQAIEKATTPIETVAAAAIQDAKVGMTPVSTPIKVVRAPISESYKPAQVSTERKIVDGDPYREPIA